MIDNRLGGRVIELFIPFETQGRKIDAISLKAVCFDHLLRWQRGQFQSSLALLVALSGESEAVIRMLRYPDADRVLEAMMGMLPETIKSDIANGVVPKTAIASEAPPAESNGAAPPGLGPDDFQDQEPDTTPFSGLDK